LEEKNKLSALLEEMNKLGADGWYVRHVYDRQNVLMCRSAEAAEEAKKTKGRKNKGAETSGASAADKVGGIQ
jgi:hypothetical protein